MIIVMSSFSKISVFETFSAHNKNAKQTFAKPAFSNSSGLQSVLEKLSVDSRPNPRIQLRFSNLLRHSVDATLTSPCHINRQISKTLKSHDVKAAMLVFSNN